VANGQVTQVELVPRRGSAQNNQYFNPTIEKYDLHFDGRKFTGSLVLNMKCAGATPGHYTWEFDAAPQNNLFRGSIRVTRDGAAAKTFEVWGDAAVPDTEPVVPAHAVYTVDLKQCVRFDNDTAGLVDTRLYLTTEEGKGVSASATVRGSGGLHRTDVSGLCVEGARLRGQVQVWMKGDGYLIRTDAHSVYGLDLEIGDHQVTGTYAGLFDVREPRRGKITGTYVNEDGPLTRASRR
jgi:hypothetical protein